MHVLLVEDDERLARLTARLLTDDRHVVEVTGRGSDALDLADVGGLDAVILDIGLPDLSGLEVARRLRADGSRVPILILTARDAVRDRVNGLDAGADDYLVKPFAAEELLARVRALLRRGQEPEELLAHEDLVFDVAARTAKRAGRDLGLSAREADLLELLLLNRRQVVSRELALERVWGGPGAASLNVVDRYVSYLRAKLGEPPLIRTARGAGFSLG